MTNHTPSSRGDTGRISTPSDDIQLNVTKSMPWYWFLWRLIPHSHGTDNMVMVEKLPDTFGAYEIWTCTKCKFTEAI